MRLTLRASLLTALLAPIGCSSLGGIELGGSGSDRFPDDEDDDGYGPTGTVSASGPSSAGTEPGEGDEGSTDDGGGSSSEDTGPASSDASDSAGQGDTGVGTSEGSESDTGDAPSVDESSDGGPGGLPPPSETSDAPDGEVGGTDSAGGTDGGCPEPAPCPPACETDLGGALPCGLDCSLTADEGYTCGDGLGVGMTCEYGVWVCLDPPADGCDVVCDPST